MKEQVRKRALELGFDSCRVTTANPPEHGAFFKAWLAAGHQGEMAYLARNAAKRLDPKQVLPNARSVVVVAASYAPHLGPEFAHQGAAEEISRSPNCGMVARYARFADYHSALGRRLRELSEWLDALGGPGAGSAWHVDTGPVLERSLAQRAGLGFIGKHTNLISRQLGNWFFRNGTGAALAQDASPLVPPALSSHRFNWMRDAASRI
jgi:epoxyqueuosine reductase